MPGNVVWKINLIMMDVVSQEPPVEEGGWGIGPHDPHSRVKQGEDTADVGK